MGAALLTLLISVAYVPGIVSATTAGRWALIFAGTAVLLWNRPIRPTLGHLVAGCLLAWCALGLFWASSPYEWAGGVTQMLALTLVLFLGAELAQRDLEWCVEALAAGVTVSSVIAVGQMLGWHPVQELSVPAGLFLNKDMLAEVAVVALIGAVYLQRWWLVPGPALAAILPGARETIIMIFAAGSCWLWRRGRRGWLLALVPIPPLVLVADLALPERLHSASERLDIWRATYDKLTWLGHGVNSYEAYFPTYEFAHNEVLHYAFELGVVGIALFIALAACALWRAQDELASILFLALLGSAAVSFPMHVPTTAFLFALVAGRLCGVRRDHVHVQSYRRAFGLSGDEHAEYLGTGALQPADIRRAGVSFGPQCLIRRRAF